MKLFVQIGFVSIFLFANRVYAQSDYVEAYYTITVNDSTTHPYSDKKDPEYEVSITQVSGFMSVEIMKSRVERYVKNPKTRKECDPLDHCPVLKGSSHIEKYENTDFSKPSFEKKYPVMVVKQNKSMGYKYDKKGNEIFTCTNISSSSGSNTLDRLVVEIKSFMAPFGILQPLNPSYVIWIEPTGGLYNSTGNEKAYSWDDFECKLMPDDASSNIDFSNVTFVTDHNLSKSENCLPLLIIDYKPFDTFMLNASNKKHTIESKGSYYSKDENDASEYFRKIEIKIILNQPYIELAPLDPVILDENGVPELAPLEPFNPELAPLEPIKK
jgi:hypothetical protein